MRRREHQLLIFDWDGTLMDSSARIISCYNLTMADFQLSPPPPQSIRQLIGLGMEVSWRTLYPECDDEMVVRLIERFRQHWFASNPTPMTLFDGVREGLAAMEAAGYWLAIATGKSRSGLDLSLSDENLGKHFLYTRCADESRAKPHPQMLLDVLDFTGLGAESAVMIGDTTYDMEMASAIGMDRLGVTHGSHSATQLSGVNPLACVDNFAAITDFFVGS